MIHNRSPLLPSPSSSPLLHSANMAEGDKKSASWTVPQEEYETKHSQAVGASLPELYDPSKESIWTRLGLTAESFKRAPGTTGYVHTHPHIVDVSPPARPSRLSSI